MHVREPPSKRVGLSHRISDHIQRASMDIASKDKDPALSSGLAAVPALLAPQMPGMSALSAALLLALNNPALQAFHQHLQSGDSCCSFRRISSCTVKCAIVVSAAVA